MCVPVHVFPLFFVASNATEKVSIAFGYVLSLYRRRLLPAASTSIFHPTVMRKAANGAAVSVVSSCYTV